MKMQRSKNLYLLRKINQAVEGIASAWGTITGNINNQSDLINALNTKQDVLVSGSNIKTINSQSILGSGNLEVGGGSFSGTLDDITEGTTNKHFTVTEKNKLAGIENNANNYVHPSNHPATIITEDITHRFVTDTEKSIWNNKLNDAPSDNNYYARRNGAWESIPFTTVYFTDFEGNYHINVPILLNLVININSEDIVNVSIDFTINVPVIYSEVKVKLLFLSSGSVTLNFEHSLNYNPNTSSGDSNIVLTPADNGYSGHFIYCNGYWYKML